MCVEGDVAKSYLSDVWSTERILLELGLYMDGCASRPGRYESLLNG